MQSGSSLPAQAAQQAAANNDDGPSSVLELGFRGFRSGPASRVWVTGSHRCGITDLLFNHAHALARRGERVLYVAQDRRTPVLFVRVEQLAGNAAEGSSQEASWDPAALARIHMKYLATGDDLRWWLSNVHNLSEQNKPSVLIVDGLDSIMSRSAIASPAKVLQQGYNPTSFNQQSGLFTSALLEDATQHLGAKLLVSVAATELFLPAVRCRYFTQFVRIKQDGNNYRISADPDMTQSSMPFATYVANSNSQLGSHNKNCFVYRQCL